MGTPVSNSMTELYTMQRYLQYDTLEKHGLSHFDAWASTFGETVTAVELAPEGTGYRAKTRFAKFFNLPELMGMFKDVVDIKTADQLDLKIPDTVIHAVAVAPSEHQKALVKDLSERASQIHAGMIDPTEDNMLKITSDGRKIGLDQRLINPMLPDEPCSKVNACTDNIYNIWKDTEADKLTQLCFCDFSTPNADGRFNVYDDIKSKLIERGVPEEEIAFIHDADTDAKKKELFAKVRQGKVRVLFGSTFKMGAGTNCQDRLIALHDLDAPWRPADLEQRRGRIVRQGNMNPEVHIYRYVTENTFDSYLYQTLENKQKFIGQIMTSKSPVRSCEDMDEAALSYAEIKALCAGNPLIREKMNLDIEVAKLKVLKSNYLSARYDLEDRLQKQFPEAVARSKETITGLEKECSLLAAMPNRHIDFPSMIIMGVTYGAKDEAGAALLECCRQLQHDGHVKIGNYAGFDMALSCNYFNKSFQLTLSNERSHTIEFGSDVFGNITRINNALDGIPAKLEQERQRLETLYKQVALAKDELDKPFQFEDELSKKMERLSELDIELNMDNGGDVEVDANEEPKKQEHEPVNASSRKRGVKLADAACL